MKSALTATIEVLKEKANELRQKEQAIQKERAALNKREDEIGGVRDAVLAAIEVVQGVQEALEE